MGKIGNWIRQLFVEVLFEGVKSFWPAIFPVLALAGQWFSLVPWPYFFAALAFATAFAIWSIQQIGGWRKQRQEQKTIAERVHIGAKYVHQGIWNQDPETCTYLLIMEILNESGGAVYLRVNTFAWGVGGKSVSNPDIEVTHFMVEPGIKHLNGPSIDGLKPGPHSGKFRVCVGIGTEFGTELYTKEIAGSFEVLNVTGKPVEKDMSISTKYSEVKIKKIKD